MKADWKD